MSSGEGSSTSFETMRGSQFPDHSPVYGVPRKTGWGKLLEVVRRFEGTGIRIVALSISDAAECAFVRFLVSHPERGREILERAGLGDY